METATLRLALYLCLAVFAGACTSAQETLDATIRQAKQARDKGNVESLETIVRNAQEVAARTNSFDANLRVAFFDSWLIEAAHDHQNDNVVKQAAQDGISAAERAVKLNGKSSEVHRLFGALLGELIPHVFAGGMRYGAHSTEEIEKAIQLDPHNPNAYVARGCAYFFTPKSFGGDQDKAIETLKKAIETSPGSDAAETAHIWLAKIYKSLGKSDNATSEINEALKLNPDRLFTKLVQAQLVAK